MNILEPVINRIPPEDCQSVLFYIIQLDPALLRQDLARMVLERTLSPQTEQISAPKHAPDPDEFGPEDLNLNKSQRAYLAACRHFEEYRQIRAIKPAHLRGSGKFFKRLAAEVGCSSGLIAQAFYVVGSLASDPKLKARLEPAILALEKPLSVSDVEAALQPKD